LEAFTGLVTGVAVWAIWGGDMFPPEQDPKGDPETWTREELRRWLSAVSRSLPWALPVIADPHAEKATSTRDRQQGTVARAGEGEYEDSEAIGH
jgi:hypothetical protein